MDSLFERFADALRALEPLAAESPLPSSLLLAEDGPIQTFYAPFDPINLQARVVLVGLTPDPQQARDAINAAGRHLRAGMPASEAAMAAKAAASFFAARRAALTARLDELGLARDLGLDSCETLFAEHQDLIQVTSILRYPVLVAGAGYTGTPNPFRCAMLRRQFDRYFTREALELARALFVPLTPLVHQALQILVTDGVLDEQQVLGGPLPEGGATPRSMRATARALLDARSQWKDPFGRTA